MRFTKLQALGNDFICLDCTERPLPANPDRLAVAMASRRLGVGADGLLCVLPGGEGRLRMVLYNADGSRAAMCGNGLRCLAAYAWAHGLAEAGAPLVVETDAGPRTLTAVPGGIRADMGRPVLEPSLRLEAAGRTWRVTPVSMGNPHAVLFVPRLEDIALEELGPALERHPAFPERINTEFVRVIDKNRLKMRVWERGSGETLACGTGACASAVAAVLNGCCQKNSEISVFLLGGELRITYTDETVYMEGPAELVFTGEIEI